MSLSKGELGSLTFLVVLSWKVKEFISNGNGGRSE